MPAYLLDSKILLDSGKVAISDTCCCGGCVCEGTVTIDMDVVVSIHSGGCNFDVHKTERLVDGELANLCAVAWGPFNFTYPEYFVGNISLTSITIGSCVSDTNLCITTDGADAHFADDFGCEEIVNCDIFPCGDYCFTACDLPQDITTTCFADLGSGDFVTISFHVVIV